MNLEKKNTGRWSLLMKAAAVFAAIGALAFTISELDSIRSSMTKTRFESKCHDFKVDIEACGQFGIRQFREPASVEEMIAGRTLLQKMCDNNQPVACREIAYSGQSWAVEFMTYRNWRDELTSRCEKEGGTACLARVYINGEDFSPTYSPEMARKMGAYCANGDKDACAGWLALKPYFPDMKISFGTACKAGLPGACETGDVIFHSASAATINRKDPSGKGAGVDGENAKAKCRGGDASACESWGSELLSQNMREWRAAPLDAAIIEETFGTACRAGDPHACIHGANAAVDRQVGTPKDTKLADEYLTIGCGLSDAQACWFRLSIQSLPLDESREIAKTACYASRPDIYTPACGTHAAIWMADNGYTPWIMNTALNAPVMKDTCSKFNDTYACGRVAQNAEFENHQILPAMFPNRVEAWSAAALACGKQNDIGCTALIGISKDWPTRTDQSVHELVESICAKLPSMCPSLKAGLEL
jgi:hypothetical protein